LDGRRCGQTPVERERAHGEIFEAPHANEDAEWFVRSIKVECLHRVIPFGERHLRQSLASLGLVVTPHADRASGHRSISSQSVGCATAGACRGDNNRDLAQGLPAYPDGACGEPSPVVIGQPHALPTQLPPRRRVDAPRFWRMKY
jgi:hypothetical protein